MKNTAEMTLGSLFDGIAGFPLAARRQGIKTVWVSEIEPDCIDIAKTALPGSPTTGRHYADRRGKNPRCGYYQFWKPLPRFERCRKTDGA